MLPLFLLSTWFVVYAYRDWHRYKANNNLKLTTFLLVFTFRSFLIIFFFVVIFALLFFLLRFLFPDSIYVDAVLYLSTFFSLNWLNKRIERYTEQRFFTEIRPTE